MEKIELLSPAGNMASLKASVMAGCNAVYLGGTLFSARAFANNFTNEEIVEAINYCHLYGVKVYVTCNILIYEHEVDKFLEYIDFLHQNNVDAILIQDLGMLDLVHQTFPNLEVHASTQMHIHNLDGVLMAQKLGCKRVVLARETSIEEIENIKKKTSIDLEIFAHGSLCVSYSGQCLFSSLIGHRSGNRGSCVGSCRLPYKIINQENIRLNKGDYPLSMKDLNTLEDIGKLIDIGVKSLKIEGRMKSPEYVYTVTKLYRMAIDSYYEKGKVFISNEDLNHLKRIFNREFTKGYLFNEDMKKIINQERPNHLGIKIGKVLHYQHPFIDIKLFNDVSIHDGLRILLPDEDYGFELNEFYQQKKLVKEAKKGDIISLKVNKKIPINSDVLLTKDDSLIKEIDEEIKKEKRKVYLEGKIKVFKDQNLSLEISDGNNKVLIEKEKVLQALNNPISKETIMEKITKLGDTVYEFKKLDILLDSNAFVSLSSLNNLRREAINLLNDQRLGKSNYQRGSYHRELEDYPHVEKKSVLVDHVTNDLPYDSIYSEKRSDKAIIKLPKVMKDYDALPKDKEYLVGELGAFNKLEKIYTDYSLNVVNSYTVALLHSLGAKRITLSLELTKEQVKKLYDAYLQRYHKKPNLEVIIKGRREVMTLKTNLTKIYDDKITLVDRFNNHYPIREINDLNYIYDYQVWEDKNDYYSSGINYLRENKEI